MRLIHSYGLLVANGCLDIHPPCIPNHVQHTAGNTADRHAYIPERFGY